MKKKVSIVIPTYNEEKNVPPLAKDVIAQMEQLPQYDYELLFIDNDSKDGTQKLIRQLCGENEHIKAIFNLKNFGGIFSPIYGLYKSTGDCAILMCADFQDPVNMIPRFLEEWEKGNQVVCGIKSRSKENRLMYAIRGLYYKLIRKMSDVNQIDQFSGYGLYDREFLDLMESLHDPQPFLRGIVAEYAPSCVKLEYEQPKRRFGKTSTNFYHLYNVAMLSFTSYTKVGLRIATFMGAILSVCSVIAALVYFIMKLVNWYGFPAGNIPILLAVLILGSMQLFFIGLLGEYVLSINTRLINRPLVIEKERINF